MSQLNTKLYFRVAIFAFLLPLTSGDCVNLDLGMESGSIPDSNITASSVQNANTPAKNGRLNFTSGSSWCAATSDTNPYLQIDLQALHIICTVSTQGNSQADQWVTNYTLQSSTDGSTLIDYKEIGQVKSLEGNKDRNSEVKHILYEGVLARYLRFLPATHHGGVCMRTEVFGVKLKPDNLALGKPTAQSSTFSSNPSIGTAVSGRAVDGNPDTEMTNRHCSHTQLNNPSWWRVDLGSDHVPVSEIYIVNRFASDVNIQQRSEDYKITLGTSLTVASNTECKGRYSFIQFKASAVCFNNPLRTGRYVGIMTTKSQILQLCEVEVYSRENLAFGKHTDQSSTNWNGVSSRGVDGISTTDFPSGRSCTHTDLEDKPWWRVDLGQVEPVSEVYIVNRDRPDLSYRLSNFEIRVGTTSSSGGVTNPKCGGNYSIPEAEGLSFFCRPPLYGRYVTIRSLLLNEPLTLCEVEVYSERRACQMQAIGVASSDAFPDSSFSATSSSSGNEASKGRLQGDGAWEPSTDNNPNDYLQIDLKYEFFICAVATQGKEPNSHWTKTYKLSLSLNNIDWVTYQENSIDKIFNGNSQGNDTVKHNLKEIARARYIRFQPTSYSTRKALRVEVFGILKPAAPSQAPGSFLVSSLSSTSVSTSWQLPPVGSRHGIITGFKLLYRRKKSAADSLTILTIENNSTLTRDVTGLHKYTEYEFQVLAYSYVGNGPKSSVQFVRTDEDVPSQPPSNFSLMAKTSTSIEASWDLPPADARHGNVTGFKLFYKKKGFDWPSNPLTINSAANRTVVVAGLEKYTKYRFKVLAFTLVGDGPMTTVKEDTTKEDVPSQPPSGFSLTPTSSSSIEASWQLPPVGSRHGIVKGFKLFYRKKGSPESEKTLTINGVSTLRKDVTGLAKYTEYEFQVLAFTVGDGPKTPVKDAKTKEDAPSAPSTLSHTDIAPSKSHGPRLNLTWSGPAEANGIIRSYTVFYSHEGDTQNETLGKDALSYIVDVLGGVTYQFHVRAVTIKPGPYATFTVNTPEYEPIVGPDNVSFSKVNETTFNISWAPLTREKSYGEVIMYNVKEELMSRGKRRKRSAINSRIVNTTTTFVVLNELAVCSRYIVSVRAYTKAGPGPYGQPLPLETSQPDAPWDLTAANAKPTQVTLEWKEPNITTEDGLSYTVKYSGTKSYDNSFKDEGVKAAGKLTKYTVMDLVPGSEYKFEVYGTSVCGKSKSSYLDVETKVENNLVIKDLPERTILSVGELAILTCEVSGDPEPSVTWSKDGDTNIPRAQFRNDGRILVIQAVLPIDSGVYECKASNRFEESRSSTTLIVAVPPNIIEDISPPTVICEKETLCVLSCHASSDSPLNYTWTKNGQVPQGDGIKILNNSIGLTPQSEKDYGVYVCHVTNSFGSTAYKITLSESLKSSTCADTSKGDDTVQNVWRIAAIALSCIVLVLLIVIGVLIWRRRRAVPNNRAATADKAITDVIGQPYLPRDQNVSEPGSYMELRPRPSEGQSRAPPEYQTLQGRNVTSGYYNVAFKEGNRAKQDEDVYAEIGNDQC